MKITWNVLIVLALIGAVILGWELWTPPRNIAYATLDKWNGYTLGGTTAGYAYSWNGYSFVATTGGIGSWNGYTVPSGAAASCQASPFITQGTSPDDVLPISDQAGRIYVAHTRDPGATKCICKITLNLTKQSGSVTGVDYIMRIFPMTGNDLDYTNPVGSSDYVAGNNSWSSTDVDFTFSPCVNVSSGTTYGFAVQRSDKTADGGNYVQANGKNAAGTGAWEVFNTLGVRQATYSEQMYMKIYSYE